MSIGSMSAPVRHLLDKYVRDQSVHRAAFTLEASADRHVVGVRTQPDRSRFADG